MAGRQYVHEQLIPGHLTRAESLLPPPPNPHYTHIPSQFNLLTKEDLRVENGHPREGAHKTPYSCFRLHLTTNAVILKIVKTLDAIAIT